MKKINEVQNAHGIQMLPLSTYPERHGSPCEPTYLHGFADATTVIPPYGGWSQIEWRVLYRDFTDPCRIKMTVDIYNLQGEVDRYAYLWLNTITGWIDCDEIYSKDTSTLYTQTYWHMVCSSVRKYIGRLRNYFRSVNDKSYERALARNVQPVHITRPTLPHVATPSTIHDVDVSTHSHKTRASFNPNAPLPPRSISVKNNCDEPSSAVIKTEVCEHQRAGHWRHLRDGQTIWVKPCLVHRHKRRQ